jgi:hypothetical protein
MGILKCKGICNPHLPFGEECGAKKARRTGMFCTECKNHAIKLLHPNNSEELSDEHRQQLQEKWDVHLVAHEAEKAGHVRNNHTFRSVNEGENKKSNQELQNTRKKAKRAQVTALKKSGDHAGLVQAAYNTPRYVNKQQAAVARGMDPAFDFVSILANRNIHLLAAAATDASLNVADGIINFTCKAAATRAMADLMIDYKKVNKLVQQYTAVNAYDLDAAPNLSVQVYFRNRVYKQSIHDSFVNLFPADDSDTVELVEDIADDLDDLRKQVQDWYCDTVDSGVIQPHDQNLHPYPSKRIVTRSVKDTIEDAALCKYESQLL